LLAIHGIRGYDEAPYDSERAIRVAESFAQYQHRVEQFFTETITLFLSSGERVLVVTHKYVVELMFRLIQDLPLQGATTCGCQHPKF